MDETYWRVANAAVEESGRQANMVAQVRVSGKNTLRDIFQIQSLKIWPMEFSDSDVTWGLQNF